MHEVSRVVVYQEALASDAVDVLQHLYERRRGRGMLFNLHLTTYLNIDRPQLQHSSVTVLFFYLHLHPSATPKELFFAGVASRHFGA